jgi:Zn-dependent protease with chaperone function
MSASEPFAASPLDGFVGSFTPPRVTFLYTCGLAAVAVAMVLLPIVYLLMIAVLAYALWWYATVVLPSSPGGLTVWLYASPLIAGWILALFMLKPLLTHRSQAQPALSLDPERERLLVAFVDRVCVLLRAPQPARIDVTVWPNASASLHGGLRSILRRKIVLTIGLPLVAGLNTRELAGVLAHELRHFSQGTGMRFSYVIWAINLWFARVAFERDEWDKWLEKPTNIPGGLTLGIALACVIVGAARSILIRFCRIGQAISCFLRWQMEYDADRCAALLSGSDAFESSLRRVHVLAAASQMAGHDLQHAWTQRELPDDVPYLVTLRVPDTGPLIDHLTAQGAKPARRFFDARQFEDHPATDDRVLAVRKLQAPGVFRDDRPASTLFSHFTELSHSATRQFYEKQSNLSLDGVRLVPSEAVLAAGDAARAQAKRYQQNGRTLADFYEGMPFQLSPMPASSPRNTGSAEDLVRQLVEARRRMRCERARASDVMRRYNGSGVQLINLAFARQLNALGVGLSQLRVNVRLGDVEKVGEQEAIATAWTRMSAERDALYIQLAPLVRAAIDRVETSLALLPLTQGPLLGVDPAALLDQALKCGALVNALDATPHALRELEAGAVALGVLNNPPTQFDAAVVKAQISKLHHDLMPILLRVVASAGDHLNPVADGDADSVAAYLGGPGELTLTFALPRLLALSDQCSTRIIVIVNAVEQAWQTQLTTFEAASQTG